MNGATFCELSAKFAGEIGHEIEIIDPALMYPAQQLTGTKRFTAPLANQFGKGRTIKSEKIDAFSV